MNARNAPSALHVELLSDATFSRGEGTAGIVDVEVEHDEAGIPFIGGKTVRGLLRDSWLSMSLWFPELENAAATVLGRSRRTDGSCRLRIGDALVPGPIRSVVRSAVARGTNPLTPETILAAFTEIRCQTAEDRATGAPVATTLRSSRVALRDFSFESSLSWLDGFEPEDDHLRLLALCSLATRHGGLLRNRGRGHLRMTLDGNLETTRQLAAPFSSEGKG